MQQVKETLGKIVSTALDTEKARGNVEVSGVCQVLKNMEEKEKGTNLGEAIHIVRVILEPPQDKNLSVLDAQEQESVNYLIQHAKRISESVGVEIPERERKYFAR